MRTTEKFDAADIGSGLLFTALGTAFLAIGWRYETGVLLSMGPGLVPQALAAILVLLGAALCIRGIWRGRGSEVRLGGGARGGALVLLALVLFGILIRGAGLYIALPVAMVVASFASPRFRPVPALVLAAAVTAFADLAFHRALGLPIPVIGSWF